MEFLFENENELRMLAENGDYWDTLHLADFLYDGKRYEEAKAQYLKIAGAEDLSGDANSHLFQMLLDMGEYEEALEYYEHVKESCDTSPREGADMRMMQELSNPESKIFMYFDEDSFYYEWLPFIDSNYAGFNKLSLLIDGDEEADGCGDIETGEQYLTKNMATILQTRTKSEDEEIRKYAKWDLIELYLEGRFQFGDFSWKCAKRHGKNIKKAIKASRFFAEHPDMIDELYCDFSYFYTAIHHIYDNYKDHAKEYARRFTVATLKYAEELGNVECVLNKIESELYDEDYGFLFNLGYLPRGITFIPAIAFSGGEPENEELKTIVIPDEITTIGEGAFSNCTSLTSVVIPASVTSIGYDAFLMCNSLTDITVDENNKVYKSIDGNLYSKDGKTLIQYATGKDDEEFVIPDGVTGIGYYAFDTDYNLWTVVIPASVTSIDKWAFVERGGMCIKGYTGSYAETYANENGFPFEEI